MKNIFSLCRFSAEILATVVAVQFFPALHCLAGVDTFEDGNDDGWTRYNPLGSTGAGAIYSFPSSNLPFPDYRYRIEAGGSPNPTLFGPARAGSFRFDLPPAASSATWTVHGWNANEDQSFGGLAGVSISQELALDGYGFVYSTAGALNILRVDDGVPTVLATSSITLDPSTFYYFVLDIASSGASTGLTGFLYESPDFITSIARIEAIVPRFANGGSGFYLFSNEPSGGIGATFDNFGVGIVPEPSTLTILAMAGLFGGWVAYRRRHHPR